jgi:hypothetical protein
VIKNAQQKLSESAQLLCLLAEEKNVTVGILSENPVRKLINGAQRARIGDDPQRERLL